MFKRIKVKKRSAPPHVRNVFIVTCILFFVLIFVTLWIVDKGIKDPLMRIAEQKTIEFATRTINSAVKSTEAMNFDNLVEMTEDNNGNVSTFGWDSPAMNEALRMATERAEYFLYGMNKGETLDVEDPDLNPIEFGDSVGDLAAKDPTVVEIPIGQATGNTILANLGPKIPVHFEIVGSLQSDIVHDLKEFGVNAALFEIYIPVTVKVQIVVPFTSSEAEISTRVLVDSRVIMGPVPEFFGGSGDGPSISIPKYNAPETGN